MAKLKTTVHVVRTTKAGREDITILGPDDEIPAWAEQQITNPDAWAEPPADQSGATGRGSHPRTGSTPVQN